MHINVYIRINKIPKKVKREREKEKSCAFIHLVSYSSGHLLSETGARDRERGKKDGSLSLSFFFFFFSLFGVHGLRYTVTRIYHQERNRFPFNVYQ